MIRQRVSGRDTAADASLRRSAAALLATTRSRTWLGVRVVNIPGGRPGERRLALFELTQALAAQGFVLPDIRENTRRIWERMAGRHVAFVVVNRRTACVAARWLVPLSRASPRGHLVIDVRDQRFRTNGLSPTRAPGLRRDADAGLAEQWMASGRFDGAEGLLSACSAEAMVTGAPVGWPVIRAWFWLRFWQGRLEEAGQVLSAQGRGCRLSSGFWRLLRWADGSRLVTSGGDLARAWPRMLHHEHARWVRRLWTCQQAIAARSTGRAARALGSEAGWANAPPLFAMTAAWLLRSLSSSRSGGRPRLAISEARGVRRWGMETHMRLLHAIPDLLLTVAREDDEGRVLQGGCRWAAEQAGAEVGFLDSSRGVVLAAQPPGLPGLRVDERSAVLSRDRPHVLARCHDVVVSAPVRYAGSIAGHVVCIGASARTETMAEAVEHLAALCAPAVRARLELMSVREQGANRIPDILGRSPAIVALREAVVRAAVSGFSVVVEGESGSGKELVARAIHRLSPRRDRRFAALNCAALTDELAETELFGHTRGAFTGAVGARAGLFEEAHLGTLFLDEVAELSARTQAKLLRAIQEREVRRLGENASRAVDVRIVAATNRALHRMAVEGLFREDLLFRLAVIRIRVPPLRERPEDIALLAVTVWKQLTRDLPTNAWLGPDALARLAQHSWPGNVRELQNIMAAVAVNAPARGRITARHVTRALEDMGGASDIASASLTDARRVCERRTVVSALARHGGRRSAAARELGLSRQGLAKAIKRLHLEDASVAEGVA